MGEKKRRTWVDDGVKKYLKIKFGRIWKRNGREGKKDRIGKKKLEEILLLRGKKGWIIIKKNEKGRGNCKPGIKRKNFFVFTFLNSTIIWRKGGRIKFKETKKNHPLIENM